MKSKLLEQTLALARDSHSRCNAALALAERLVDEGDFKRGITLAEDAQKLAAELDDPLRVARASACIAVHARYLADYARALACHEQALATFAAEGQSLAEAECLRELAMLYLELEEQDPALECLEAAQSLLTHHGNELGSARLSTCLGFAYQRSQNPTAAREQFSRALQVFRRAGETIWMARALLGMVMVEAGTYPEVSSDDVVRRPAYEQALGYLQEALDYAEREGNPHLEMMIAGNTAVILSALGRTEEALALYTEQLARARQIGHRSSEVLWLCNMAEVYRHQKRFDEALSALHDALGVAHATDSLRWSSYAHMELSKTYEAKGDIAGAFAQFKAHHQADTERLSLEAKHRASALVFQQELSHRRKQVDAERRQTAASIAN